MKSRTEELLEFLQRSGASLYSLLIKLTLREDIAEELMQELFIRLNKSRRPHKVVNLYAYAHRTAINLALDWQRSQKSCLRSLEQVPELAADCNSVLSKLEHIEELQQVLKAMSRLNRSYYQALILRYVQQESYEDIAEQLDTTPHHVRAMCSRALNQIRDILQIRQSPSSRKGAQDVEI